MYSRVAEVRGNVDICIFQIEICVSGYRREQGDPEVFWLIWEGNHPIM